MTTTEYLVSGMTCGHCELSVREEVGRLPGVTGIEVSAETGRLAVTSSVPIPGSHVLSAVEEAGYTARPMADASSSGTTDPGTRGLL